MSRSLYFERRALTFNGVTDTLSGWARRLGLTVNTVRERLNRGWSVEEALTLHKGGDSRRKIRRLFSYKGRMMAMKDIVKESGMSEGAIRWRLTGGYGRSKDRSDSVDDAVTKYKKNKASRMVEYNGCKKPLSEWCRIFGLNRATVWARIHQRGMSVSKALSGRNVWNKMYTANGETHCLKYWWRIAKGNGVTDSPYATILHRVKQGEELFDALMRENMTGKENAEKMWATKKFNERARELRSLGILV